VESEDVGHVLRNMINAVKPGGLVLDLQVIRPDPRVEVDGRVVCKIDGEPLFRLADAAAAAVDASIAKGRLLEEAVDDHDVRKHYRIGADLVADFAGKERKLPVDAVPTLRALKRPCVVREHCRLRRLRLDVPRPRALQRDSRTVTRVSRWSTWPRLRRSPGRTSTSFRTLQPLRNVPLLEPRSRSRHTSLS
jgi:hypothetical protein